VMVNDSNADLMNISFWTNASGTWQRIGGWHTGYNNTYIDTNATSMNQYNTIYYWSVNATDDELWTNTTYSFSTNDWLPGYNYRKALTITGQGGSGPNYQINISLGSSSGGDFHLQGNAVDFPNDIRFTDNDKVTLLEYWIENMSADPITVWVKVNDTLNTTQTIYVYYGNSTATTTSDGEDTFVFFDDFETDLSKWTTWCQCGDAHVERNNTNSSSGDWSVYVYTSAGSCRAFLNLTQTVTTNFAVEFNWSVKGDNNEYHNFVLYEGLGTTFFGNIYATDSTPPTNFAYYDGSLHLLTAAYTTAMEWHSIEEHYNLSSDSYHIYIDDALNKEDAPFVSAVSELNQLKFQSGAGSNNGHQFIDTFRIRKWNDPEPSFSTAGAQETPS